MRVNPCRFQSMFIVFWPSYSGQRRTDFPDRDFPRPIINHILASSKRRSFEDYIRIAYFVIRSPASNLMVLNQSSLFPEICYPFQTFFWSGQRRTDFEVRDFPRPSITSHFGKPRTTIISGQVWPTNIAIWSPVSNLIVLNQSSLFPEICYTFQTFLWSGQRRTDFEENHTLTKSVFFFTPGLRQVLGQKNYFRDIFL